MNITLFAQIITKIPKIKFQNLVEKYNSDKHSKGINSWTHLIAMLFCQFSKSESLRDVCNGLCSATGNLNHLGVSKAPKKSSLSYLNKHRNWQLFKDFYFELLEHFNLNQPGKRLKIKLKRKIYLLDSTTISLCLSLFDWAKYRTQKGAIKLHTLLDFDGLLPTYVHLTDGKSHDAKIAKLLDLPKQSVVVGDRGYFDLPLLYKWQIAGVFFVVRCKENVRFSILGPNSEIEKAVNNVQSDWIVEAELSASRKKYPKKLRLVEVYDDETGQYIEILTNNFSWTASTIAELYKQRWQIEIFFKSLKQHLKIKSFIGTSENAVRIQIWTALITMLLFKYFKNLGKYNWSFSNLIAFIRLNLFVKIDLKQWLDKPFIFEVRKSEGPQGQMELFNGGDVF